MKNYSPFQGPPSLRLKDLWKKFDKTYGALGNADKKYGKVSGDRTFEDAMKRRKEDPWNFLFIAGMWFQDLFNYDFRRTEMCIIPYATQQGEISFCAYNTGVGWRKIIENMHKNATVAQWYKEHGKHDVFAKGKKVNLESYEHSLRIDARRCFARSRTRARYSADRGRRRPHPPQEGVRRGRQSPPHLRRARAQEVHRAGGADWLDAADLERGPRRNRKASADRSGERQWPIEWKWPRKRQRRSDG